jgi:hypothetical protein
MEFDVPRYCRRLRAGLCGLLIATATHAQDIGDGSVSGDLNTNIGSGAIVDSNNATENLTNNYNATGAGSPAPVPSAVAPTVMGGGGNQSCLVPTSTGVQVSIMGLSSGSMTQDEECNRRRDAALMGTPQAVGGLGLQVSGISILCGDNPRVFRAMMLSATPCPIMDVNTGRLLVGRDAFEKYRSAPDLFVVGYRQEKAFWDALLRIGEELPNVETNNDGPSLSDRFRVNGRTDNDGLAISGSTD